MLTCICGSPMRPTTYEEDTLLLSYECSQKKTQGYDGHLEYKVFTLPEDKKA